MRLIFQDGNSTDIKEVTKEIKPVKEQKPFIKEVMLKTGKKSK